MAGTGHYVARIKRLIAASEVGPDTPVLAIDGMIMLVAWPDPLDRASDMAEHDRLAREKAARRNPGAEPGMSAADKASAEKVVAEGMARDAAEHAGTVVARAIRPKRADRGFL